MITSLLDAVLKRLVRCGTLKLILPDGRICTYGNGKEPKVVARITSRRWLWRMARDPDLYLGEAYMAGALTFEEGDVAQFMQLLMHNVRRADYPWPVRLIDAARRRLGWLRQLNFRGRAKRNVAHHYDLDGRLYALFLDPDRQYSCAYFDADCDSLEEAQLAKKRHLAAKLLIRPGQRILDIGCGWGGLALYLAQVYDDVQVVGITLSEEQHAYAQQRAQRLGLEDRVQFRLQDYRDVHERFDRIVSVGMFEHVGVPHYPAFFAKVRELLSDDGIAVLHSINRADGPGATSRWIDRYIFPGGYIPALSEVVPVIEKQGLIVSDIEILRLHYGKTLKRWRENFLARKAQAARLYDERFVRMWEFYLAASEAMFRSGLMNNFQIQMVKEQAAVPLTRDYMFEEERRLKRIDARRHVRAVPDVAQERLKAAEADGA